MAEKKKYKSRFSGLQHDEATNAIVNKVLQTSLESLINSKPNPNLLDNWYFGNPVNQRGKTEYSETGYCLDRWYNRGANTIALTEDGLKITASAESYRGLNQRIEFPEQLVGKTVTVSLWVVENTLPLGAFATLWGANQVSSNSDDLSDFVDYNTRTGLISYTFKVPKHSYSGINFGIYFREGSQGGHITIKAVKLELGSQQTLAYQDDSGNWVLNEIPDFSEQLAKCQRDQYNPLTTASYHVFGLGTAISTTQAVCVVPVPVTMRLPVPALEINDVTLLRLQSSSSITLTALSLSSMSNGCAKMIATVAGGLTVGQAYALTTGATNPTIIINANQ